MAGYLRGMYLYQLRRLQTPWLLQTVHSFQCVRNAACVSFGVTSTGTCVMSNLWDSDYIRNICP